MEKQQYTTEQEQLARLSKAMGHPARMAILEFLAGQHSSIFGEIHSVMNLSKATVSQHLSELHSCGLVDSVNEGVRVRYSINRDNWRLTKLAYAEFFANVYRERGAL